MNAAERERIADMKHMREGYKNSIQIIRTDLSNPERVINEITRLRHIAATLTAQADAMQERLDNGPNLIDEYKEKISDLTLRIKRAENAASIEELIRLSVMVGADVPTIR